MEVMRRSAIPNLVQIAIRAAVELNQSMRVCLVPTPNCRVWWKQHETAMKLIAQADSLVLTMYSGEDDLHVTY
jgi:hypothetical protein